MYPGPRGAAEVRRDGPSPVRSPPCRRPLLPGRWPIFIPARSRRPPSPPPPVPGPPAPDLLSAPSPLTPRPPAPPATVPQRLPGVGPDPAPTRQPPPPAATPAAGAHLGVGSVGLDGRVARRALVHSPWFPVPPQPGRYGTLVRDTPAGPGTSGPDPDAGARESRGSGSRTPVPARPYRKYRGTLGRTRYAESGDR